MNPLFILAPLLSWLIDRNQIQSADERAMGRMEEGRGVIEGAAEQYTPQALLNMVDFPSQGDIGNMFTSYDAFNQYAPGSYEDISPALFDPESVAYNYNPEELRAFGADIGDRLRGGGTVDFGDVMSQISERFPDADAWEAERLSGVSQAGQQTMQQAREAVRSEYGGDLASGASAMKAAELGASQATGRSALQASAEAENMRRQMAVDLGTFQTDLAKAEEAFGTSRDIAATTEEGRLFGLGEGLVSGTGESTAQRQFQGQLADLANLFQSQILNRTIPMDYATLASRAQMGDQAAAAQMMMSMLGMQTGLVGQGAGMQMGAAGDMAQLIAGFQENIPLLSEGLTYPMINALLAYNMRPDSGGGGFGMTAPQFGGGGIQF